MALNTLDLTNHLATVYFVRKPRIGIVITVGYVHALYYSLPCVLSSIDDSQLTKGHPDVDDHTSSPPAKKPRTSSYPDTSGGVYVCVCVCITL